MATNLSNIFYRTKDSSERDGLHPEHLVKRPCTISPSQRFSPSTGLPAHPPPNGLPTHPPNGLSHPPNPQMGPQHYRLEDMALAHQYRDAYRHSERDRHRQTGTIAAQHSRVNLLAVIPQRIKPCAGAYESEIYVENKEQLSVLCDNPSGSVSI